MKRWISLVLILTIFAAAAVTSSCKWLTAPKSATLGDGTEKLIVHFIDVGQGDCTLLESDDEFVLIDAGERDCGEQVLEYIEDRGADELKYVIATHPHTDHIGGLRTVLNGIDAENFITSETDCATNTWTKLLTTVDSQNINYIDAVPGKSYRFGQATFTIMAPLSDNYDGYNSYSVVTKVTCGGISFLIAGDAEKDSEAEMVKSGEDLTADVLRCGHHGSSTSSSVSFLKAVQPAYVVISCGANNEYGHPHKEPLTLFNRLGCTILRTDEMGTIAAITDGQKLTFRADGKDLSAYTFSSGETTAASNDYVGNKNSQVFHYATCGGVKTMNPKNKVMFSTREEAIANGYTPCSVCNP